MMEVTVWADGPKTVRVLDMRGMSPAPNTDEQCCMCLCAVQHMLVDNPDKELDGVALPLTDSVLRMADLAFVDPSGPGWFLRKWDAACFSKPWVHMPPQEPVFLRAMVFSKSHSCLRARFTDPGCYGVLLGGDMVRPHAKELRLLGDFATDRVRYHSGFAVPEPCA